MITVIDAPCGTGKTRKAIEYMKANPDTRFIYITPFLSEVERIKKEVPSNTRSTNEYINCHYVMYLLNRYINPFVKFFFDSHGVTITKEQIDMYALSEMIQFIYRSAVRNGEDIYVYVPSERMRNLLHKYIQLA